MKLPVPDPQPPSQTIQADPAVVEKGVAAPAGVDMTAPVEPNAATPTEVNTATSVKSGAAALRMVPPVEPEATVETPMHPQDVDLGIPPQEVTSAYVKILTSFFQFPFSFHSSESRMYHMIGAPKFLSSKILRAERCCLFATSVAVKCR